MLPMAYLLDFTKSWTYNRLPVTCVDDRDRNGLYHEFHKIVRWHQEDVTRGSNVPQEQAEPREPPEGMIMLRLMVT